MLRRRLPLAILIFALAEALFLFRLAVPHQMVFDETHYVPAARALLELSYPSNLEHPLLGKWLIACGMRLFGDTPFGWRFASTIAGATTITAVFALTWLITGRRRPSLVATLFATLGFTVYVQARIAMLDTFMLAFLLAAMVAIAAAMRARDATAAWGWWTLGAVLLGAAVACKWIAAPYVAFAAIAFWMLKREDARRWASLRIVPALAVLGAVSIATYFATFAPAFSYANDPLTLARLLPFQLDMYARQTQVLPPHTYQSQWWTWPLLVRPIWYLYEPADGAQRGIWMIGNPVVMWAGLAAVAACWWGWIKSGAARLFAVGGLWVASLAIWAAIPKSLGFYYYYYPSSVFLAVVLAVTLDHWRARRTELALLAAAALMAVYFAPVLSALPLSGPAAFKNWTWFRSWV